MNKLITIGTRGSELALWQANFVKSQLEENGFSCKLEIIKTQGDQIQNIGFDKMEGKGFFTKELEEALLTNAIDIAVHSCKDLESVQPKGLTIAAYSKREDPSDVILIRKSAVDRKLKFHLCKNAFVGTSSNRRKALLKHFRPDVHFDDLRGNVPTRIQKLVDGKYDAIVLASAGIKRLNLDVSAFHIHRADEELFIPAAAQGVLAIQCRDNDQSLIQSLRKFLNDDQQAELAVIERKLLELMEGGCKKPLGIYCYKKTDNYHLHAAFANETNDALKRIFIRSNTTPDLHKVKAYLKRDNFSQSVFISRNQKESEYFYNTLGKIGFKVNGTSLTRFESIPFKGIPQCDWIFFSSRNCVKYFFSQNPKIPQDTKIGSIGGSTAEALIKRGIESHFTGHGLDTVVIGKDFSRIAGNAKVLFPQSTASFRTVQKQFTNQENVIDMVVYDTIANDNVAIPDADIVVLTSPSNAILYFRKKNVLPDQVFIPIGLSTAEVLKKNGISNFILPWNTNEIALADAVMSL